MTRPSPGRRSRPALVLAVLVVSAALAGCAGAPLLANPPVARPAPASPSASPSAQADPVPVVLPRDDGAHHRLTEWWYYTGHLASADGRRFGFEFVVFRAERGSFPVSWASHLALTDETGDRFLYAQRSEIGPRVDVGATAPSGAAGSPGPSGSSSVPGAPPAGASPASSAAPPSPAFAFALTGFDPTRGIAAGRQPWTMARAGTSDRLAATATSAEASLGGAPGTGAPAFGIDLTLDGSRPAVLHDGDGWIDFGPAGGSYYYSRPRLDARGSVTLDGTRLAVTGTAWFDHQWGDFISVGGGWDWFAANLADGADLTLSLVRTADGAPALAYGTLVAPDGRVRHLPADAFSVTADARWTSPATGATYPAGWRIAIPSEGLELRLRPTVAGQELDTRATTGVVYWEGSQRVAATRDGAPVSGEAYVELTGYGPATTGEAGAAGAGETDAPGSAGGGATADAGGGRSTPEPAATPTSSASSAGSPSRTASIEVAPAR